MSKKKILHLCLANFYIDNYSYQENILPKYHKKLGYDVSIIASLVSFNEEGKLCLLPNTMQEYITRDGIPITRLEYKSDFFGFNIRFRRYMKLKESLLKLKPDVIFVHGCQFADIKKVVAFKKQFPDTFIYIDNHADYINSGRNWLSKNILHKIIWRYWAKKAEPYVEKFYGVTPLRSKFLNDIYDISKDKIEDLIMGIDLDLAGFNNRIEKGIEYRSKLNIANDEFVIITGGKIDSLKNINLLIKAFEVLNIPKSKLLVFGNIAEEIKVEYEKYWNNKGLIYLGWQDSIEIYNYMYASNIAVFPGTHSVLWEQAIGLGLPTIVRKWRGFEHLEINESVITIEEVSVENIINGIKIFYCDFIYERKIFTKALSNFEYFSYENIAKKSIESYENKK